MNGGILAFSVLAAIAVAIWIYGDSRRKKVDNESVNHFIVNRRGLRIVYLSRHSFSYWDTGYADGHRERSVCLCGLSLQAMCTSSLL